VCSSDLVIKKIQEDTGATIEVDDAGVVYVSSADQASGQAALDIIKGMMAEPEIGAVYHGKVKSITDFGAFVEYLPGKEGLLHISELEHFRVGNVEDVLQMGEEVDVKLVEVDGFEAATSVLLPETATEAEIDAAIDWDEINDRTEAIKARHKAAYIQAMTDLATIKNRANPTNAQVVWAVKREAETLEQLLKVVKRLVT